MRVAPRSVVLVADSSFFWGWLVCGETNRATSFFGGAGSRYFETGPRLLGERGIVHVMPGGFGPPNKSGFPPNCFSTLRQGTLKNRSPCVCHGTLFFSINKCKFFRGARPFSGKKRAHGEHVLQVLVFGVTERRPFGITSCFLRSKWTFCSGRATGGPKPIKPHQNPSEPINTH